MDPKALLNHKDLEYNRGLEASTKIRQKMKEKRVTYKKLTQLISEFEHMTYTQKPIEGRIYRIVRLVGGWVGVQNGKNREKFIYSIMLLTC